MSSLATSSVFLPTLRVRKASVSLVSLLQQEYQSKYGCVPPLDPAWQREPWCRAFLCALEGPVVEPEEAVPCTS